jgi:tripartite-type tricarboxylate transporter receptor subunit TctC
LNKPGANGDIGYAFTAKSAPDGYTLLWGANALVVNPYLYPSGDLFKELAPVSEVARYYFVLCTLSNSPFNSLADVIKAAKEKPDSIFFGSASAGGGSHLAGLDLMKTADIKVTPVPYQSEATNALLAGQISLALITAGTVLPQIKAGAIKALAVGSPKRLEALPNVPAIAEQYPGYVASGWFGLLAPKGVSSAVVDTLAKAMKEVLQEPAVVARMKENNFDIIGSSPSEFAATLDRQYKAYGKLIKDNNIKLQ